MTKEDMIAELQMYAEALGRTPTKIEFCSVSETGYSYEKYFGTWNNFVRAAGLPITKERGVIVNKSASPRKKPNPSSYKPKFPIKELHDEICRLATDHPEMDSASCLLALGQHSPTTYRRYLGGNDNILCIIEEARNRDKKRKAYGKRYSVTYAAFPVALRWSRRRSAWTKEL